MPTFSQHRTSISLAWSGSYASELVQKRTRGRLAAVPRCLNERWSTPCGDTRSDKSSWHGRSADKGQRAVAKRKKNNGGSAIANTGRLHRAYFLPLSLLSSLCIFVFLLVFFQFSLGLPLVEYFYFQLLLHTPVLFFVLPLCSVPSLSVTYKGFSYMLSSYGCALRWDGEIKSRA